MNRQKKIWQKPLRRVAWLLGILGVLCTLEGQVDRHPVTDTKTTLAEEQLLSIVKKHEALLGQYEENPAKFEKRELSTRVESVINAYKAFNNDNPDDVFGYVLHGKFLREIGRYEEAHKLFLRANKLDSNIAIVKQQIGNYLAEDARYKEAYPYFVTAVKLDPQKAVYQWQLGRFLIYYGKQLVAEKMINPMEYDQRLGTSLAEAVRLAPENRTYKNLYAESFYDLHKPNWNKALQVWTSLLGPEVSGTQTQAIQLHRARVLAKLNRKSESRKLIETVQHPALAGTKRKVLAQLDAREEVKDPDKPNTAAPVQPKITEPPVSSTNQTLKLEVEQLRKELANLKKKENTKPSPRPSPPSIPVTTHNKALADFGDNLKQLEEDKKKLFKDLEASRQQTADLQKDLQSKNTANKTLETNLETTRKAAADLQKLLDAQPGTVPITQHNKELADLKKVLNAVTKAKTSLEAEGETAKAQLAKVNESARKRGNDLRQAIAERDAAKVDLKKHLKEKETIAQQFAKEKKGLMTQVDLLQKQSSEETVKMAADLQKELTKEQVNAGQMQKARDRQKKEIDFLNKELANLEGKLLNLLDSKTKTERQQGSAIKEHLATIEALKNEIKTRDIGRQKLLASMAEKSRNSQELRQKLQDTSRQNQAHKALASLLEGVVGDLADETTDLLERVEIVSKEDLEDLKNEFQSEQKKSAGLQEEIEKLQSQQQFAQNKDGANLTNRDATIADLQKQLAGRRNLGKQLAEAKDATQSMKSLLELEKKEKQKMGAEVEKLQALNQVAQTKVASTSKEMAEQFQKANELETEVKQLHALVEGRDKTITGLKVEIADAISTKTNLVTELDGMRNLGKQLAEAKDATQSMKSLLELEKKEKQKMGAEVEKLQALNQVAQTKVASTSKEMAEQLKEALAKVDAQTKAITTQQTDREKVDTQLETSWDWIEILSGGLEDNLQEANQREERQTRQVQELEARLQAKSKMLVSGTQSSAQLEQGLDKSKTLLLATQKQLADQEASVQNAKKETQQLTKQLDNTRSSLNRSEVIVKGLEKSLKIQVDTFQEKEATLQENLESVLNLKARADKQAKSDLETIAALQDNVKSLKTNLIKTQKDQKAKQAEISELNLELKKQKNAFQRASKETQSLGNSLQEALAKVNAQTKAITAQQTDREKADTQLDASWDWIEILSGGLEDNLREVSQREERQTRQIQELEARLQAKDKMLASGTQSSTQLEQEMEKSKALLLASQKLLVGQEVSVQNAKKEAQQLAKQLAARQATDKKNSKITEALTQEIGTLKTQSEKLVTELQRRDKKAQDLTEERESLKSKLETASQNLDAANKASAARDKHPDQSERVAMLEVWVDTLTRELTTELPEEIVDDTALLDRISTQSRELTDLQIKLEASVRIAESVTLELEATKGNLGTAKSKVVKLEKNKMGLDQRIKELMQQMDGLDASKKPLKEQIFVEKKKTETLGRKVVDLEKDNKFLTAELNSLEDNLLKTLRSQAEDEKRAARQIKDIKKQLVQAEEAVAILKNSSPVTKPDKAAMAMLEKQEALTKAYEKQIRDLRLGYTDLEDESSEKQRSLQKQIMALKEKLKAADADKANSDGLAQGKIKEITDLNSQLVKLESALTTATVPQDKQIQNLRNQLNIISDNETSLRNRIKGLDEEKIKMSEKLVLAEGNLDRARKQLSTTKTKVEALAKIQPSKPIKKQLETVKKQLASYRMESDARLAKLDALGDELARTKKSLVEKGDHSAPFAKAYQEKLIKILASSAQLQVALEQARDDLKKTQTERNQTLVALSKTNSAMESKVKNLQQQLANTNDQLNRRTQTTSREREMLAQTLERLSHSESTIQQLQQDLAKSNSQNNQLADTHALLMDKLVQMEQENPLQPRTVIVHSKQRITQLETALQHSNTKLAKRDRDFEDVITKMNRILERLHTNPTARTP